MSSSTHGEVTYLSFTDTGGVKLQPLTGRTDYHRWTRDFKIVALHKNVWGLYTGDTNILEPPNEEDYIWIRFQRAHDKYKKNSKLVREANAMLSSWVHPAIRLSLDELSTPKAKWDWLRNQYKPSDTKTRLLAYKKMDQIKMHACKNMQDYLNQLSMAVVDIREAGGVYNDDQLICKAFNNLATRFDTYIDQHYNSPTGATLMETSWDDVKTYLLDIEHTVTERYKERVDLCTSDP